MSEVQSMVEQVARAIEAKLKGQDFLSYEDAARAAIEAMREPTDRELDAVRYLVQWHSFERPTEAALLRHAGCLRKNAPEDCRDVEHVPPTNMVSYWIYRGVIDAALNEQVAG
jgi:hypothetical protein